MASKWGIDGVFSDMRIEEMGTSFHESRTSGQSLFCDYSNEQLRSKPFKEE